MTDRTRPPSSSPVRDRVRNRWLKLAQVAVIAVAPVANTACDPAPRPYCANNTKTEWLSNVAMTAQWVDHGGVLWAELTITVSGDYVVVYTDFTVTGGTLQNTPGGQPMLLQILPGTPSASPLRVEGTVACDSSTDSFTVLLGWQGPPTAGAPLNVTIQ